MMSSTKEYKEEEGRFQRSSSFQREEALRETVITKGENRILHWESLFFIFSFSLPKNSAK